MEIIKYDAVSDKTSNLEHRKWINAGSTPVGAKCECCVDEIKDFNSIRFCSIHCRKSFIAKQRKSYGGGGRGKKPKGDWACCECNSTFETRAKLYEHRHKEHNVKSKSKNKECFCKYCGELIGKGNYRISWQNHRTSCKEFLKNHTADGHRIWSESEKEHISDVQRKNTYRRIMRHTQEYNGTLYDSSWEVDFAKRLDSLGISYERPKVPIPYIGVDGLQHNYFPDFWVPEIQRFVEIKNSYLFENDPKVKILRQRDDIIWLTSLQQINEFYIAG